MRLIKLTDAISAVEEVFKYRSGWRYDILIERFPYGDSDKTPVERLLEMYSNAIVQRLINDVESKEAS